LWDKRKNAKCLSRVFETLSIDLPNARLIIKSSGDDIPPEREPSNITYVSKHISEGQMNALFRISDAYVSAHHSEGWGLPMSDAMLFGIPVIATAYSGNLEFMNEANSFLVKARETYIAESDCFGKFDHAMRWAEPDHEELRKAITFVATHYDGPVVRGRVVQARRSIGQFNRDCVSGMMFNRLRQIEAEWRQRRVP
ncbi:MAG: glycosyltransferase, partial [Terriglobia bacterium]